MYRVRPSNRNTIREHDPKIQPQHQASSESSSTTTVKNKLIKTDKLIKTYPLFSMARFNDSLAVCHYHFDACCVQ